MTELNEHARRLLDAARNAERPTRQQRLRAENVLRRRLKAAGQAVGVLGTGITAAAGTSAAASSAAASSAAASSATASSAAAGTSATAGTSAGAGSAATAMGTGSVGAAGAQAGAAASSAAASSAVGSGATLGLAATKAATVAAGSSAGMSLTSLGAKLLVSAVIGVAGAGVGHEVITHVAPMETSVVSTARSTTSFTGDSSGPLSNTAQNPAQLSRARLFPGALAEVEASAPSPIAEDVALQDAPQDAPQDALQDALQDAEQQRPANSSAGLEEVARPRGRTSEPQRASVRTRGTAKDVASERLAQQVADLELAQQLLSQRNASRAIAVLEASERQHASSGSLRGMATERWAMRAVAYCAAGDPQLRARGAKLATTFLQAHPNSPLAPRVQRECVVD